MYLKHSTYTFHIISLYFILKKQYPFLPLFIIFAQLHAHTYLDSVIMEVFDVLIIFIHI